MAQEWGMSMGMDMDFGLGMRTGGSFSTTTTPEAVAPFTVTAASSPATLYGHLSAEQPRIDDFLDFSNHDNLFPSCAETTKEHCSAGGGGGGGSCPMAYDQKMSSSSGFQSHPSSFDLYIPCEEAAELEWLSKFVDDSFSDVPNYNSICLAPATGTEPRQVQQEQLIAAARGTRSRRSRVSAASAAWASALIPPPANQSSPSSSSSSSSDFQSSDPNAGGHDSGRRRSNGGRRMKEAGSGGAGGGGAGNDGMGGGVRRCTHCASEKTPQWRTGPLGPKTLCNACGVRYKSGRLVPEYRPAASPTFLLTQHSNSHRKVVELRRQKELHLLNNAAATANPEPLPELFFDDRLNNYGVR